MRTCGSLQIYCVSSVNISEALACEVVVYSLGMQPCQDASPFLEELDAVETVSDSKCEAEDGWALSLVLTFRQGFLKEMTSELRSKE